MTALSRLVPCAAMCLLVGTSSPVAAQRRGGDPVPIPPLGLPASTATDTVVKGAPYSADATTTVAQVLGDGTRIERTVTAKVYRDGVGRLRRDQTVLGLASLAPATDGQRVITIVDPVERVTITLDERTRTARRVPNLGYQVRSRSEPVVSAWRAHRPERMPFASALRLERAVPFADNATQLDAAVVDLPQLADRLNALPLEAQGRGGRGFVAPAGDLGTITPLGSRQMEGLTVTGRRTTQTIPAGAIGNDRPIVITDELWESPALQVVVSLRHSDPRTGTLEYRLSNIVLGEPAPELFTVPPGYTVTDAPRLPLVAPRAPEAPRAPSAPGARGDGGRGTRSGGAR